MQVCLYLNSFHPQFQPAGAVPVLQIIGLKVKTDGSYLSLFWPARYVPRWNSVPADRPRYALADGNFTSDDWMIFKEDWLNGWCYKSGRRTG